jgi:hypothetical protein
MGDEEITFHPPEPIDIARRALILSAVVCRATLESYTDAEYKRQTAKDIHDWFDQLELWPYLEPVEEEIIRARFGKLPTSSQINATWYVEGLAILAWALRRADFPPHDQKVDPIAVTNALDFLNLDAAKLVNSHRVRSQDVLQAAREWFYDLHCTLRCFLHHKGDGRPGAGVRDYLKILEIDPNRVIDDGCVVVDGSSLCKVGRKRVEEFESIVRERHRAAIWLVGEDPVYTDLNVDT